MNTNIGILGRKIGMTQIFDDAGNAVPVTAIEAGPCLVSQKKSAATDGYDAIQLAFGEKTPRNVPDSVIGKAQGGRARYELLHGRTSKPLRGHFFKVGESAPRAFVREIRLTPEAAAAFEPGQQVTTAIFEKGQFVDVIGTSKGKGFTGVVKRHGFTMFPESHGVHEWTRHGGSIGTRKPRHTRRGHRMAGHSGHARATVQNLLVAGILADQNILLVRGGIPGPNGGYVVVRKALKRG